MDFLLIMSSGNKKLWHNVLFDLIVICFYKKTFIRHIIMLNYKYIRSK